MNPKKAFRKFGDACLRAPAGSMLTVGLTWIEDKGWRVMMQIHTHILMLGTKDARGLAAIYEKNLAFPEYAGNGLEWVAPELRKCAEEADQKNDLGLLPPEMLQHVTPQGSA